MHTTVTGCCWHRWLAMVGLWPIRCQSVWPMVCCHRRQKRISNFVYKENGRGMVSVSKTVDCAVCCCFPLLPPFLFLPFDLQLRMKIGKKPTVAAEWNHRGNGPSATASFDEGRSGSAGSNISHAVKPFLFSSPKAATGEIALWQFHQGQLLSVVWGMFWGSKAR